MNRKKWIVMACAFACVLLCNNALFAQMLVDDFSDGNFTSNPTWAGDDAVFIVNASGQLQLNDLVADQSYLSTSFTSSSLNNREWHFFVKQTFAGSDANQSRIYFAANGTASSYTGAGSAGVSGYFLKLGEGGSADVVRIYKDSGTAITELAACATNISSTFQLGIKIVRDASGNWQVLLDASGGTNYVLEASFSDTDYTTSSAVSFICTYTSSNADNFFFDNVFFGDIIVDTAPPQLIAATAISATELDVLFDEALNISTAQTLLNYSVAGMGNPIAAVLDNVNSALVHLTFLSSFTENVNLTLQVSNMQDEAGNVLINDQIDFLWFVPAAAYYRSVVFNEVLADPSPVVGLPEVEFVEIYNTSSVVYDLAGWQFVNSTTVKTLTTYALQPGEFVILCDANSTAEFSNAIGIPSFSALTNGTDSLTLLDNNNVVIDVLVYNIDWYATVEKAEGGWSLEQINPLFPCGNSSANWAESVSVNGGTPNAQNSVYNITPDTTPPTIISVSPIDATHFLLQFSEVMDISSWANSGFTLLPGNSVSSTVWSANNDAWLCTTDLPLDYEIEYEILNLSVSDCSGNALASGTFTFIFGVAPQLGDLIINEIYPDPDEVSQLPFAEYVELYNKSNHVINLQGTMLNSGLIEDHIILYPDSFIVLADDADLFAFIDFTGNLSLLSSFPSLTNSGLLLQLKDANDNVIDEVDYDITWYRDGTKDDGGWSLELINPNDPCSNGDNWRASSYVAGGSPGAVNSVYDVTPDIVAPHLLYVLSQPQESITLVFNEPINETSLAGLSWTVNGEVQSGLNAQLANSDGTAVVLYYGEMEAGVIYSFDLLGITDCWGNDAGLVQSRFALPESPQAGDIIINEILANPYDGGKDFVEIYNNSLRNISIVNWYITDVEANGTPNPAKVISEIEFMLYPGEYLVLTEDGSELPFFYWGTQSQRIFRVADLPEFSAQDAVILIMPNLTISDAVYYNDAAHFPLLNSLDGVSLERIAFDRPSSDITNWHSASEYAGFATPGYANSQSNNNFSTEQNFEVINEIFSPDNDGFQDVVTFAYKLDAAGYTGNITIYDSEGHQVRRLLGNGLMGTSGSISWDGFNDERLKASIGIYVVYFEVFDLQGNVSRFKKPCVLAHQLD
jgi:Lamin Tail Domain